MASTYLSRTSSTPTNALKWTFSAWVKISGIANDTFLLDFNTDTNNRSQIGFSNDSSEPRLVVYEKVSGSTSQEIITSRLFRDPSAWYHIVVSCDRTLATSSDRTKIYVNGVQETSFTSATYPTQNVTGIINTAVSTLIGKYSQSTLYFDGSMTHFNFIDGTAYDASTFGETDATTGIWKPKTSPSVTYGTNGFFLKFENSADMDFDSSPNNLTFSTSGNLTQTVDTPSNVFCTMNPLDNYLQQATFTNGNTTVATATVPYCANTSTLGVNSGKWYFEWKIISMGAAKQHGVGMVGLPTTSASQGFPGLTANAFSYNLANGNSVVNNSQSSYGTASTVNDIYGMAVDLDNNKFWVQTGSGFLNSGDPASGTNGITITSASSTPLGNYFVAYGDQNDVEGGYSVSFNFGNGYFGITPVASAGSNGNGAIFEFDCPSGYYALNTKNINTYG
jgi:hypothetical protein